MLLLVVPAARAELVTVGTGDLRAEVETDPWSLAFIGPEGDLVAGESRAMPIGYRTAAGWSGATRAVSVVRDGPALVAEVETAVATPAGAIPGERMRVRIGPGAPGTLAIEATPLSPGTATALGMGFDTGSSEHFYGIGERPEHVEHAGAGSIET